MTRRTVALALALAFALAVPGTALARGGAPGGTPTSCTALTSVNPFLAINRKARADLKLDLRNCAVDPQIVTTTITSALDTVAADGTTSTCTGPTWTLAPITLKPGDHRTLTTTVPSSTCPLGVTGALVRLVATATDATGNVVGRANAQVMITLAF